PRVRGAGNYTDDVSVPGETYAAFVRTPHAHARIVSIDVSAARGRPGVLAVRTGEDYVGDGHIGMAHFPNPADANDVSIPTFAPTPERKILDQLQPPLAVGCVRFVGEAVAVVVAESAVAARDAAEAVAVEYQGLPAGARVLGRLAGWAPARWAGAPKKHRAQRPLGDRRCRGGRHQGRARRDRADDPQPAHRQRVPGAARGHRQL